MAQQKKSQLQPQKLSEVWRRKPQHQWLHRSMHHLLHHLNEAMKRKKRKLTVISLEVCFKQFLPLSCYLISPQNYTIQEVYVLTINTCWPVYLISLYSYNRWALVKTRATLTNNSRCSDRWSRLQWTRQWKACPQHHTQERYVYLHQMCNSLHMFYKTVHCHAFYPRRRGRGAHYDM